MELSTVCTVTVKATYMYMYNVLKFCLTDQSLSKNGLKYFPAGKKEMYHCRQRKVQLVSFKNYPYTHNRGQLESLLGGAKRGGGGPKYEA